MSSRLKERGGSGGKIMASKPSKTLLSGSLKEKPSSQKIPLVPSGKEISRPISAGRSSVARTNQAMPAASGKENPRPISAGRPSIAGISAATAGKENPRPISVGRASVARTENLSLKPAEKPAASASATVRWSTSLLPRGKFTDLRSDLLPPVSRSMERRSFAGFSALDKDLAGKGRLGKNSSGNGEKSLNVVAEVLDDRRLNGCLGGKSVRNAYKVVDAKPKKVGCKAPDARAGSSGSQNGCLKNVSGCNLKPVDGMGVNGLRVLDNHADGVILFEAKQFEENGHGNVTVVSDIEEVDRTPGFLTIDVKSFDSSKEKGTLDLLSKSTCEAGGFCVDNTANHMVKDCLNLQTSIYDNVSSKLGNAKADSSNTFLLDVHHRGEAIQLGFESVRTEGNIGVEVKDVCTANKYQSKLHEKLALLEGKVQKIALEIKETKEMLDKNKPGESKLVLSDIQKKICGVEKAVHSLKDGAKSELASSDAGKVGSMQNSHVVSNIAIPTRNSSASIKGSNNEVLEARFFPHHKAMSDCLTSFASGVQDKSCKSTFSKLNLDPKLYNGFINEKPIELEVLTTLNVKKPKTKMLDVNVELNHGVVSKMQLDSTSSVQCGSKSITGGRLEEVALVSNEKLEEFDILGNNSPLMECLSSEESSIDELYEIGRKISTGGWFVSEGEAILLAHDDNSCSYYDIANNEVKSEYKPPAGLSSNLWGDCWLIRAPGTDGCFGRYIVAASAGNALESGFCSWDFYTKDVKAFQVVGEKKNSFSGSSRSTVVAPSTRTSLQTSSLESQSCWYRPCGPLLISTSSRQKVVNAYDIRDGDLVMTWEVHSPVTEMEYSCPVQWRSKGKAVIAEKEAITLWDVNSLNPQPVLSVPCIGKKIYSLHVNNTDAEIGAGVRQRASSIDVEGNDGVFCSQDSVNVFDFRIPSGAGLKISRHGANALSIFSLRDSIFVGSTEGRLPVRSSPRSQVEHFSLRKGKLVTTYVMPEFNSHYHHSSISQVWGNSNLAMGICGMGMFVFDAFKDEGLSSSSIYKGNTTQVKETIGPDDLYRPTFDYMESRTLIISRDRPAFWRYLP